MRVRILKAINARLGNYKPGDVAEIEDEKARSLIGFGIAEQDKMIDAAPETKIEPVGLHRGAHIHTGPQNATLEVLQGTSPYPVPPPGIVPEKRSPGRPKKTKE